MQKSVVGSSENTEHNTEEKVRLLTFFFILLNGLKIFQIFQAFSERLEHAVLHAFLANVK